MKEPAPIKQKYTAEAENEVPGHGPTQLGGVEGGGTGVLLKARPTPALPAPIETLSDDSLVAYLDSLQYDLDTNNNEVENAECVHANTGIPCGVTETARAFIQPEIGMHLWKHTTIPRFGVVAARIINYDTSDREVKNLRFPAHTRVWWVVDYDAMHRLRSRYFRRNYSATAPAVTQIGPDRTFAYCEHMHAAPHPEAIAKFVSCSQSLALVRHGASRPSERVSSQDALSSLIHPVALRAAVPLPATPQFLALTATWVTCDAGCCSTSP